MMNERQERFLLGMFGRLLSRLGHTSSPSTQSGLHVILYDFDLLLRFLSEWMGASREDV
jgi:hypothetical protein